MSVNTTTIQLYFNKDREIIKDKLLVIDSIEELVSTIISTDIDSINAIYVHLAKAIDKRILESELNIICKELQDLNYVKKATCHSMASPINSVMFPFSFDKDNKLKSARYLLILVR